MEAVRELRLITERLAHHSREQDALDGLSYWRTERTTSYEPTIYAPMLYFVLQGAKQLSVGGETIVYEAPSFLILSMDMPVEARVASASSDAPFLAVEMRLMHADANEMLLDFPSRSPHAPGPCFGVGNITPVIVDPLLRLARLDGNREEGSLLGPLYKRELLYRVAQGPYGMLLREALGCSPNSAQIRRAIAWIKEHYRDKLRIEGLAEIAGLSVTTFHRRFKAATKLSPGAYHKRVRLHEARRMLASTSSVSNVAFSVGYESASQFSREYSRQFGVTPGRQILGTRNSR